MDRDVEQLKQRLPLLEYLQRHNWTGRPSGTAQEFVGLCPLHQESHPSFYVNSCKNLFYCHGCGRGGDLIRFVGLSLHLPFRQSIEYLLQELTPASDADMLEQAVAFYQLQLERASEGALYLEQRGLHDPAVIEQLGIGYAGGGNLHRHRASFGYSFDSLLSIGLINNQGRDAFCRRVIFPCRHHSRLINLYGRSIGGAFPHRLLRRSKGGLVAWDLVSSCCSVILVEGLFDLAVLWQAGFHNTTCAIGTQLTPFQFGQLTDTPDRRVCIAFDNDENQAGQRAAHQLARRLADAAMDARIVQLPAGHDPNSYFAAGATTADLQRLSRAGATLMRLLLVHQPATSAGNCPYRLMDEQGSETASWANEFPDAQHMRQLSPRSLRAYAYDLLHFARWFQDQPQTLSEITGATLLDYVRHQLNQQPRPTAQTINHRLTVIRCLYPFHPGEEIPAGHAHFPRTYATRPPPGYGRPNRVIARGLRLKQPRRVIQPLSAEQVAAFGASFRTFRDLAVVGLMLLDGLRSCEILTLQLEDVKLADTQLHVPGKGRKQRILPLPGEIIEVLQSCLRLERPLTNSPCLFVSLQGRHRGQPMTPAGLRSLFRHHRLCSDVPAANPHRFRHTFGADMVRAGISLPALQFLMGHSQIHTTMLYVQLAPQDVWREYARAVANRSQLISPPMS
jgi:DNA primase